MRGSVAQSNAKSCGNWLHERELGDGDGVVIVDIEYLEGAAMEWCGALARQRPCPLSLYACLAFPNCCRRRYFLPLHDMPQPAVVATIPCSNRHLGDHGGLAISSPGEVADAGDKHQEAATQVEWGEGEEGDRHKVGNGEVWGGGEANQELPRLLLHVHGGWRTVRLVASLEEEESGGGRGERRTKKSFRVSIDSEGDENGT